MTEIQNSKPYDLEEKILSIVISGLSGFGF